MNDAMTVCEILLPLVSDVTKLPFPQAHHDAWEAELVRLAGGATWLGVVRGSWIDEKGLLVAEFHNRYQVAVRPEQVGALRALARAACAAYEQRFLYLQIGTSAELVEADAPSWGPRLVRG